ncbi:3-dehydroquinate synthase [Povalibacter uvarum]|uniref:3-dehydroquinate synthase n=1 Tax=Povalibacter uvarum TaxID=732238 RepID=A0A841HL09_9GAMM|nr:3-dehydroquinate synthase [Povalibacter uvarum]MBB6092980.1 3-dehydroquinate synthase [Povalibacter uvarum]
MTQRHEQVDIELGDRSYPILIGPGLLSDPSLLRSHVTARDVLVVTNETIASLYLPKLTTALDGKRVVSLALPDGEEFKTLDSYARILDALMDARMNRDAAVVALGGGVVGDMAGFAAASYQRGIDYVQVPTTLLAQVDSSVGGKTAVNHPKGKNMIGAFYQPRCVIADTSTLATLPDREYRAGIAEVVKYGLIYDPAFFDWLEANVEALLSRADAALIHAIRRSCEIKAEVVGVDEREQGLRAILNLGHTFGHAIETAMGYGNWLHGEAVAAGMVMAADMSSALGWLAAADRDRTVKLLTRFGLPTQSPRIGAAEGRQLMGMDKKVLDRKLRLVLLRRLGQADIVSDYPNEVLEATLKQHFG